MYELDHIPTLHQIALAQCVIDMSKTMKEKVEEDILAIAAWPEDEAFDSPVRTMKTHWETILEQRAAEQAAAEAAAEKPADAAAS